MFKNKKLIKATALVALGLGVMGTLNSNNVDAASWRISLKHAAAVYNYRGHRSSKHLLKRGTRYTAYRYKSIHGHKYVYIGRGRYIKIGNTSKVSSRTHRTRKHRSYLFKVNVTGIENVSYSPNGKKHNYSLGDTQTVYQEYTDKNGLTWYRIGKNVWVKSTQTDKPKAKNLPKKAKKHVSKPKKTTTHYSSTPSANVDTSHTIVIDNNTETSSKNAPKTLTDSIIEQTNQEFLKLLNNWRASQGLQTVKLDYSAKGYAMQRAQHNANSWDTYKHSDNHEGRSMEWGECIWLIPLEDPKVMAQKAFNSFVYEDGDVNWEHRDILGDPTNTRMFIGLVETHNNGYYRNGIAIDVEIR